MAPQSKNPVVKTTTLRAYPGWVVREYQDGTYDGAQTNGPAITIGAETFQLAIAEVRMTYYPQLNAAIRGLQVAQEL